MYKFRFFTLLLAVILFLGSCQEEEPLKIQPDEDEFESMAPAITAENGYLVFKDMATVDSIVRMLNQMGSAEIETWEKQFDYKSARSVFDPLFDEYEKIETMEQYLAFKAENRDVLRFRDDEDPEDFSMNYRFSTDYYVPILNSEGVVKIGESITKYTDNNQIIIADGDANKLSNLEAFADHPDVIVMPKLKSEKTTLFCDFTHNDPFHSPPNQTKWWTKGERRLLNELKIERTVQTKSYSGAGAYVWVISDIIYFSQTGHKKGLLGKWKSYNTVYEIYTPEYIINNTTKRLWTGKITSSEKSSPNIQALHVYPEVTSVVNPIAIPPTPSDFKFRCKSTFRGFDGIPYNAEYLWTY